MINFLVDTHLNKERKRKKEKKKGRRTQAPFYRVSPKVVLKLCANTTIPVLPDNSLAVRENLTEN